MARKPQAVIGIFSTPDLLIRAVAQIRTKDFGRLDALTPYPVHGLAKELGLPQSPLGVIVFLGGLSGALFALALQGLISAVDYPLFIGGKPFFSWPAFVPIIFELMVLFASFTAFFAMLGLLNRLPHLGNPVLKTQAMKKITRDKFGLLIERSRDNAFDVEVIQLALLSCGAESTELVFPWSGRSTSPPDAVPFARFGIAAAVLSAVVFSGWATHWLIKLWPELPANAHMSAQQKLLPYAEEPFFIDEKGMRVPPEGSVARGALPYPFQPGLDDERAGMFLSNPLPFTRGVFAKGEKEFERKCAVCHGSLGDGQKLLSKEYLAQPANLQSGRIGAMPAGRVFHVITVGKGTMPAYQSLLDADERWAIVHYLRTLQRAQNATEEEVKKAQQERAGRSGADRR